MKETTETKTSNEQESSKSSEAKEKSKLVKIAGNTSQGNGTSQDSDADYEALINASFEKSGNIEEGEVVKGKIARIRDDYVIIDIGYKSEGRIPRNQFKDEQIEVGGEIDVFIEDLDNEETDFLELSKEKADRLRIWDFIDESYRDGHTVKGKIVARVKGGLSVDIGVKAFLPGSQVDLRPVRNLDNMLNKDYEFQIIKFNKKRGNIVLSRRAILEKERDDMRQQTISRLQEGEIVTGSVKNITDYGAFIDLGGIDGLLHITDMSWGRIKHPSDILQVGDEINVKVLKFDQDKQRVSLGLKQITEDPWKHASETYPPGTILRGRVASVTDYGAFIELAEGVEGLVHVSEMSWTKRVKHPGKIVKVGDMVEAKVLDIDIEHKRISLSMKQAQPNPWNLLEQKYPVGTKVIGKVRNITDFGIFLGVEEDIDGLVHISDLSWTQKVKHPSELYKKGDDVEAVVINIDPENERFSLSIKALTPDPWTRVTNEYRPNMKVRGKVMKLADFGAFVELEPGVEGLLHVSEISHERIEKPADVLKKGDELDVMIIEVDPVEKKISLSKKALDQAGEVAEYRSYMAEDSSTSTRLGELLKEAGVLEETAKKEPETVEAPKVETE